MTDEQLADLLKRVSKRYVDDEIADGVIALVAEVRRLRGTVLEAARWFDDEGLTECAKSMRGRANQEVPT